ncbi:MAG TPA: hypothetical protein VM305_01220 [Candidatus Limnocylindrales bacterium]|nr:hypothetical protein [Candidatus Limnocylindrales bacterium]
MDEQQRVEVYTDGPFTVEATTRLAQPETPGAIPVGARLWSYDDGRLRLLVRLRYTHPETSAVAQWTAGDGVAIVLPEDEVVEDAASELRRAAGVFERVVVLLRTDAELRRRRGAPAGPRRGAQSVVDKAEQDWLSKHHRDEDISVQAFAALAEVDVKTLRRWERQGVRMPARLRARRQLRPEET